MFSVCLMSTTLGDILAMNIIFLTRVSLMFLVNTSLKQCSRGKPHPWDKSTLWLLFLFSLLWIIMFLNIKMVKFIIMPSINPTLSWLIWSRVNHSDPAKSNNFISPSFPFFKVFILYNKNVLLEPFWFFSVTRCYLNWCAFFIYPIIASDELTSNSFNPI